MTLRSRDRSFRVTAGAILTAVVVLLSLPAAAGDRNADGAPATELLSIPNARIPMDGVLSGGQPSPEQIEAAARAGFRTVINMRSEMEKGFEWEPEAVEKLGMRYIVIPVAGVGDLSRETAERFDETLTAVLADGPVLLHCASGNRIGAILALREAWVRDAEPEAALNYGVATGLTRLEPKIRELLGVEPDNDPR